jgi:hypothetical protein
LADQLPFWRIPDTSQVESETRSRLVPIGHTLQWMRRSQRHEIFDTLA